MVDWRIMHDGKPMYLDYETCSLLDAKPIIKSYHRLNLAYHVRKSCLGIYRIYCEKMLYTINRHDSPVGSVELE